VVNIWTTCFNVKETLYFSHPGCLCVLYDSRNKEPIGKVIAVYLRIIRNTQMRAFPTVRETCGARLPVSCLGRSKLKAVLSVCLVWRRCDALCVQNVRAITWPLTIQLRRLDSRNAVYSPQSVLFTYVPSAYRLIQSYAAALCGSWGTKWAPWGR
jgi:hypothetical protein